MLKSPSGKIYIGITSKTAEERWRVHNMRTREGRNNALQQAIRKYGAEHFVVTTLATHDDWGVLCDMERAAIVEHGSLSPGGYNLTVGGEGTPGWVASAEARAKISAAQKIRFSRPEERSRLLQWGAAAREKSHNEKMDRIQRLDLTKAGKKRRPKPTTAQRSATMKAAMARPEVMAKIVACAQRRAADPEWRGKISKTKTGVKTGPCSEQRKHLVSEARKREWADPVIRQRRLDAFAKARKTAA